MGYKTIDALMRHLRDSGITIKGIAVWENDVY